MRTIIETLKYKPVTVFGLFAALQTFMYGVGYLVPFSGFTQTVLYVQIGTLVDQNIAGTILLLTGVAMAGSILSQYDRVVKNVYHFDALMWLFAFLVYAISGAAILGFAIAGIFSLMAGYVAFAFPNRKDVALYNALE